MTGIEKEALAQTWADVADDFVTEFCRRMLASLKRRDQRTRGEWYVSGLLSVPGRKSMRALAAMAEHGAAEQSLHHFISNSSWTWGPVRQTLARHLDRVLLPQAWVVHSMAIPKAGVNSVGVAESFRFDLGRVANSQQAYGVSLANEHHSVPVNWGLDLPSEWLVGERRRQARIPDDVAAMSPELNVVHTAAELAGSCWGLRRRPVILDARTMDPSALIEQFTRRGVPFVMRVDDAFPVIGFDPGRPGAGKRLLPARQLAERGKQLAKPVSWTDPEFSITRSVLVGGTRVTLPAVRRPGGPAPRDGRELTLIGGWSMHKGRSRELWLSNLLDVPPAALLRLGRLTRRVSKDFAEVSTRVGVRDFEGRSYAGWHRHVTLCSVAHATLVLSATRRQRHEALSELSA